MRARLLPLAFVAASFVPALIAACGSTPRPGGEFDEPDTSVDATITPVDGGSFTDSGFEGCFARIYLAAG